MYNNVGCCFCYYSPSKSKYVKDPFGRSGTINKSGTKFYFVDKTGKQLDKKYKDVYAMSIKCKFELECDHCGADVVRNKNAGE